MRRLAWPIEYTYLFIVKPRLNSLFLNKNNDVNLLFAQSQAATSAEPATQRFQTPNHQLRHPAADSALPQARPWPSPTPAAPT